ncbi:MAG: hypothetical protein ACYDFT_01130 [Thermoplasmata archaeon]
MAPPPSATRQISGTVFIGVMLAIAAVLFYLAWFLESAQPFVALVAIGALALLFGLVAYLLQAFVQRPMIGRAVSWGFLGMGFVILFATATLYDDSSIKFIPTRLALLLATLVALAVTVLGLYWRSGQIPAETERLAERKEWQTRPTVSAFDYVAARPPEAAAPPAAVPPTPPGGR